MMNLHKILLASSLALALAACGGGGDDSSSPSSGVATASSANSTSGTASAGTSGSVATASSDRSGNARSLQYVDPTGKGWRLVRDEASTKTRLVLNLVGPRDIKARGVGFNLRKGKGINFSAFPGGAFALNTGVFELKGSNANFEPYAGTPADPVLFVSAPLSGGDVLSTGIFQKDRTRAPKDLSEPVLQIAIEMATVTAPGAQTAAPVSNAGDVIALQVVKAKMVPADIGAMDFLLSVEAIAKARMVDIEVEVGRLTAQ